MNQSFIATLTLVFVVFLLTTNTQLIAQSNSITGRVADLSDGKALPGAHISAIRTSDQFQRDAVSDERGFFWIKELPDGDYRVEITFLGYRTMNRTASLGGNRIFPLQTLALQSSSVELDQVEVTEQVLPAVQNGDTTQYNANAFKTNPDANAEDLVRKMPGVVLQNGQVQAQGENVQEVLVDGKPFFGNDPAAALKNLPAEIIDKIEIFDQQSEQSQFSGFNDGETTKTMNIVTKKDMRNGQFGKVFGGYGTDERYQAGGNINLFNGDSRTSIILQSNNINTQNFATEDLLGVVGSQGRGRRGGRGGQGGGRGRGSFGGGSVNDFLVNNQSGITQTHALGLNYTDNWGEKLEVAGSYFFNWNENTADQLLNQELINDRNDFQQFYDETTLSSSTNRNHRFNLRLDYDINDKASILLRPRLSIQQNEGAEQTIGETFTTDTPINNSFYDFNSELTGINFSNTLLYRQRFEKRGRSFSVRVTTQYNENSGDSELFSATSSRFDPTFTDTTDQINTLLTEGWTHRARVIYTEPLARRSMLQFSYDASLQQNNSDQETFDFSSDSGTYSDLNTGLSNIFDSEYRTHQAGLGYVYRGKGYFLTTRVNAQWASLDNEQQFPFADASNRSFFDVLPFAMFRYRVSKSENLRIFYRTNTDVPSINQLQSVIDNSNPLQLSTGNPNLRQSYQHRLFLRYSKTNTTNASVFYTLLSASTTNNYIANSTTIAKENTILDGDVAFQRGAQLIEPVNLDGYWNLRSFITYGLPVKAIKSNLNFNLSGNYVRQPGLIDQELNYSNNATYGLGVVLSSNISQNVDFTISSTSSYNTVTNTLNTDQNTNYFNQVSEAQLTLIFKGGWVVRTNLTNQLFSGFSETVDQNFWLWNASVGKKLFKNQRGELNISMFDILRQNTSIQRNITETYIEDIQTEVLQQYFMLNFVYQLRHFGTPKKREKEEERDRWRRRMGW
ncbi:MAG: TonB-dependent receptor [Bacteroidota bacterium]